MQENPARFKFHPLLEERRPPWGSLGVSALIQVTAVAVLIALALFQSPEPLSLSHFDHIALVDPLSLNRQPPPQPKAVPPPRILKREIFENLATARPAPKITAPPMQVLQAKASVVPSFEPAPSLPAGPKVGRPVRLDVLTTTGSSATPTLAKSVRQVQTGGFGDPNGVPVNPNAKGSGRGVTLAAVGSFDLPAGPGYGNGSGGSRGARGVVASAGFGNGVAIQGGGGRGGASLQTVRQTSFDTLQRVVPVSKPKAAPVAPVRPVLIVAKPNPIYTDEARRLHVEGEVLLEVVFAASGDLRVVRVLRGLGYGLDEAAIRAAQQIRFTPATQNGQPVDFEAKLHIVFQLS